MVKILAAATVDTALGGITTVTFQVQFQAFTTA